MNRRALTAVALLSGGLIAGGCSADEGDTTQTSIETTTQAPPPPAPPAAQQSGTLLDPDAATKEDLAAIPGMTPELADAVIAGRPYSNMTALDRALGTLSEEQRDSVYTRVWKPIDLNTATDEEILLIPRLGDRMLHEFKEYRPYTSMDQFRREIGKYVDAAEVARLEQYVMIK